MKVTADMLRAKDACEKQVKIFEKEWPRGTRITKKACLRAWELGLDTNWFASELLEGKAWKAYKEAIDPAWEAYEKAIAQAWKAYKEAIAPAWEAYEKAEAQALEAYDKAIAQAWKAYEKAIAIALYEAVRDYGGKNATKES